MEFIIDYREKKIKEHFYNSEYPCIKVKCLDLGDIQCVLNDEIVLIIERKTLNDLAASIKDGRYREQKMRLKTSGVPFIILIEGMIPHNIHACNINRLNAKTVVGSIINMCIRDKIHMLHTASLQHTLYFLDNIYQKCLKRPELFINKKEKSNNLISLNEATHCIIKPCKKSNLTPTLCSIAQMSQIPSVSRVIAKGLIELYGSVYGLCMVYASKVNEQAKIDMLTNKLYLSNKGILKPFGQNVSKQVYVYLTGTE